MIFIASLILSPVFYIFFGIELVVFHLIQVVCRLFGRNAHDASVALLNLTLTRTLLILGTKVTFNNFREFPTDKPLIILSNHQSTWDIPPIMWKFRKNHPKFIAKKELAKYIPSVSYNLKYGGSVVIDRKNPREAVVKIKHFAREINKNCYAVCIFPEGTRSKDGKIAPFKSKGVESILKEMPDAVVVPIAIKNTGKIDNNGKFLKGIGVHASYTLLPSRKLSIEHLNEELEGIRQEMIEVICPYSR